mmetsp:Transcript_36935/g.85400  ORF Transcript_36935/g.85400 Transcript_36935/m.85400 type:complete len:344 (-) Transcript_36935:46-1077(-)
MVLGGDVAAAGAEIHTRLVHAAIAKLHLVGVATSRQRQELMPEANSKDRQLRPLRHDFAETLHGCLALLGVTRTVGDEKPIASLLREVVVPRDNLESNPQVVDKVSHNVELHPAIDSHDKRRLAFFIRIRGLVQLRRRQRHLRDQIFGVWILPSWRCIIAHNNCPKGGTFLSEALCNGTRVYTGNARNVVLRQPFGQALHGRVMGCCEGVFRHNHGHRINPRALKVPWNALFVFVIWRHSVIADNRVGQHQDLTFEGGICQRFWISHHGCAEHHFAGHGLFCSEAAASPALARLEPELDRCLHRFLPCRKLVYVSCQSLSIIVWACWWSKGWLRPHRHVQLSG